MDRKMKHEPSVDPEARRMPEYSHGKQAFFDDLDVDDCPHVKGFKRISWMCGWYDERTRSRLGHIFKRRNMQWP